MDPTFAMDGSATDVFLAFPGVPALDNTLGAALLGSIFGFMLYGVMLHQAFRYYRLYPGDALALKCLILLIVAMETLHTVLWIIICYEYLIVNYFNPFNFVKTHWYIQLTIPVTAFTGSTSLIFYAGRVYYMGPQYRPLVAASIFVWLLSIGWDFAATVKVFRAETIQQFSHFTWIVSVAYGLAVLCDFVTACALIYALRRSRTGIKRTDSVVDALVIYTVNTGLLTTVVGLLVFIFAILYPGSLIYAGLSVPAVKLYSNSVLAMLNSRRSLRERLTRGDEVNLDETAQSPHGALETWNVRQITVSFPDAALDITRGFGTESEVGKA